MHRTASNNHSPSSTVHPRESAASAKRKGPRTTKTSKTNEGTQPTTSWTTVEQELMPILLALMTRLLPEVIVAAGCPNGRDSRAVRRLVDRADVLLLTQVPELGHVAPVRRRRYWRALFQAMVEDKVVTFRRTKKLSHPSSP